MVASKLDELGVDYIEGGYPLSNPKDAAFFQEVKALRLRAVVSAFGMTRRRGISCQDDPGMASLLEADTAAVTIVGKTSDYQVLKVLGVSLDENVEMIADTVRFMRSNGRRVIYDAEHFFDTFRSNPDYALRTLAAAEQAGAETLVLCDTNGGGDARADRRRDGRRRQALLGPHRHPHAQRRRAGDGQRPGGHRGRRHARPGHGQRRRRAVREHGHPDPGRQPAAEATATTACGTGTLTMLTEVSRFVCEIANVPLNAGQPYVGTSAFAHKGGMHVHAVQKDASTYEHAVPESVGNQRKILVSEMSGASNIAATVGRKFGIENDRAVRCGQVLERVQDLENEGYQFEAADGSLELLVRKQVGRRGDFFRLDHYRTVILRTGNEADPVAEATVKLHVGDTVEHTVAEGDGPVNALDNALRRALRHHYPSIDRVRLLDYKVRVINSKAETAAKVRVVIESRRTSADGAREVFGTIGVGGNVIDASWAGADRCVRVPPAARAGGRRAGGAGAWRSHVRPRRLHRGIFDRGRRTRGGAAGLCGHRVTALQ